jgi:hypothetical protein
MRAQLALYDGWCGLCHNDIEADVDHIICVDGEWVHAECAEDEGVEVEW